MKLSNFLYHCLGACFRPYKLFLSLQTLLKRNGTIVEGNDSMIKGNGTMVEGNGFGRWERAPVGGICFIVAEGSLLCWISVIC